MKRTTISMSNAMVMTSSPTLRICACIELISAPRVAWRTSEARERVLLPQHHLIFSYTSLTIFLRALRRRASGPVVSSCSSTMAWILYKGSLRKHSEIKATVITHGAVLNALERVSVLIAENVFVITATNRLISQKLSTMRQVIKKKQDMKNSASITLYINVDH